MGWPFWCAGGEEVAMGYRTWRDNVNHVYVGQIYIGVVPGLVGSSTMIIDNCVLKADRNNAGIIYVTIQDAALTQRFVLNPGDMLSDLRASSFETFRIVASQANQILWVYAELPYDDASAVPIIFPALNFSDVNNSFYLGVI
jgi:hypothetical protein